MSQQITTAFIKQYKDGLERLLQQEGGVLRKCVRVERQASEQMFYDQIGGVRARQVTERFAPSPQVDTPHARRSVTISPYDVGDFYDTFDKVQVLNDPTSDYVQNFKIALGQEEDRVIYQALFGTAMTGKTGSTSTAFSTTASTSGGQIVVADFGTANSGLTIEKLIEAQRVMLAGHNQKGQEPWYIVINSDGLSDLLNTTETTSADYNSVKALVGGDIDTFLGFKFIQWEGYETTVGDPTTNVMRGTGVNSETVFKYPVFTKSSLLLAVGMEIEADIVRRWDRSGHWYAYAKEMLGATRMQEKKVAQIERFIS